MVNSMVVGRCGLVLWCWVRCVDSVMFFLIGINMVLLIMKCCFLFVWISVGVWVFVVW